MQKAADMGNIKFLIEVVDVYSHFFLNFGRIDDAIFYLNQLVFSYLN